MSPIKSTSRNLAARLRGLHNAIRRRQIGRIVRSHFVIKTVSRVVTVQNNASNFKCVNVTPQLKTGLAFFLCFSLQRMNEESTQVSALRLNSATILSTFHDPFLQPPIIHLTALFGILLNTGRAALKRNYYEKLRALFTDMEDMDDEQDYSDDELNPNPADTMILALGLASAMVETFNPVLKSKPKSSGRSVSKDPVKVDINFEEYDILASILKRTKAMTKEFNEKNLDPIQDLLKLKQPKSAKTPVYSLLKKSGKKKNTIGVSLVRNCVSDLLEKNKSKYDWWTSMTDFSTPPPNPGRVLSSLQSSYSKYDVWKDIIAKLKQTGEIESTSSTKSNTVNGKQSNEDVTPESSMKEFTISEEETIQERASEAEIDMKILNSKNLQRLCDDISRITKELKDMQNRIEKLF